MAFWQVYPRKVARAEAWKAWRQVGAESIAEKVTTAIAAQTEADFQFRPEDKVPQGASWLRAERWNDVVKARGNGFGEKTEKLIGAVRDWTPRKATS